MTFYLCGTSATISHAFLWTIKLYLSCWKNFLSFHSFPPLFLLYLLLGIFRIYSLCLLNSSFPFGFSSLSNKTLNVNYCFSSISGPQNFYAFLSLICSEWVHFLTTTCLLEVMPRLPDNYGKNSLQINEC